MRVIARYLWVGFLAQLGAVIVAISWTAAGLDPGPFGVGGPALTPSARMATAGVTPPRKLLHSSRIRPTSLPMPPRASRS